MTQNARQQHWLEVARAYHQALLSDEAVLGYLAARGIEAAGPRPGSGDFLLGLVSDPGPEHEPYRGRLSIPYICQAGVRTFKFRCLADHDNCKELGHQKYLGLPGAVPRLFNVSALLTGGDTVAVCEGELDAVVCTSTVGLPAVGVPGVDVWHKQKHWPRLFCGYDRVVIVTDHDQKQDGRNPGLELANRIARDLEQAVVIQPPSGTDLTEWVLQDGADAVREKLA